MSFLETNMPEERFIKTFDPEKNFFKQLTLSKLNESLKALLKLYLPKCEYDCICDQSISEIYRTKIGKVRFIQNNFKPQKKGKNSNKIQLKNSYSLLILHKVRSTEPEHFLFKIHLPPKEAEFHYKHFP